MSQVKLAAKIGITKMTLYKYERNICEPRGEIITRLAQALNTTADFILGLTNDSAPRTVNPELENKLKSENEMLAKYRALSTVNKAKIEERIDILLEQQSQK